MFLVILTILFGGAGAIWLYVQLTCSICRCTRRLDGLTAIVTGANTGIGKETARRLAEHGARVILACRDMKRAKAAQEDIIASTGNQNVIIRQLDLSSLQSVRDFAQCIHETEPKLHLLVNNAGILMKTTETTADGLETIMQVNHLGPFLLTHLLLDILKKSAPSRIVMVSSSSHAHAQLDIDDLNSTKKKYYYYRLYSNSKLCNNLTANEMARRLSGTGVTINSVHPGGVRTDVWRQLPDWQLKIVKLGTIIFFKDCVQGAQTVVHVALSEKLENVTGQYFAECKIVQPAKTSLDEELAKKLWDVSVKYVGLKDHEMCVK